MSASLSALRLAYAARRHHAQDGRAAGRKVVAYAGQGFPEALAMACGCLPYRLSGNPDASAAVLDRLLYPLFNKAQSVRGLIRREQPLSLLAQILDDGRFADRLVVMNGRKDTALLLTHLRAAQHAEPALGLPEVSFLDRAGETGYAASLFARDSVVALAGELATLGGRPADDAALRTAVATCGENLAALHAICALRMAGVLAGADGLAAIGAGWFMPKQAHTALLHALAGELAGHPPRPGPRLVLVGGAVDHAHLHAFVDTLGATIVLDWHEWGEAALPPPIDADMAPLDAIARQFHAQAPGVATPLATSAPHLARQAAAGGLDGAIILADTGDELMVFDAPDIQAAFAAQGLPVLRLADQPYGAPNEAARRAVAEFCAAIPARAA